VQCAEPISTSLMENCRHPSYPLIPGHEIVGQIVECGAAAEPLRVGMRVGIPWLGWTCGNVPFTAGSNRENLCDNAKFTGYTLDGGYAEFSIANARLLFFLCPSFTRASKPLHSLRRADGYRSLTMTERPPKVAG